MLLIYFNRFVILPYVLFNKGLLIVSSIVKKFKKLFLKSKRFNLLPTICSAIFALVSFLILVEFVYYLVDFCGDFWHLYWYWHLLFIGGILFCSVRCITGHFCFFPCLQINFSNCGCVFIYWLFQLCSIKSTFLLSY